jgi:hypothetical protein
VLAEQLRVCGAVAPGHPCVRLCQHQMPNTTNMRKAVARLWPLRCSQEASLALHEREVMGRQGQHKRAAAVALCQHLHTTSDGLCWEAGLHHAHAVSVTDYVRSSH